MFIFYCLILPKLTIPSLVSLGTLSFIRSKNVYFISYKKAAQLTHISNCDVEHQLFVIPMLGSASI